MDTINVISSSQGAYSAAGNSGAARFKQLMDASAQYLGLSADDLRAQLQAGKSLADIAKAEGKSVDGLKEALQAVLSSDQSQGTSSSVLLDRIINGHPGRPPGREGDKKGGGFEQILEVSAKYLGLSTEELQSQLESGKSLADIAQAEGKGVDGLKEALQAALPPPPVQRGDETGATSAAWGTDSGSLLEQLIFGHPQRHHQDGFGAVGPSTSGADGFTSGSVNLVV